MGEPPAIKVARSVLDRQHRFVSEPGDVSTMALMQAWDFLIGAPEDVTRALSVSRMAHIIVGAATAVMSIYEICEGRLPKDAQDIGQRAIGVFEIVEGNEVYVARWCRDIESKDVEWGWSVSKKPAEEGQTRATLVRAATLDAVCEKLRDLPETNVNQ